MTIYRSDLSKSEQCRIVIQQHRWYQNRQQPQKPITTLAATAAVAAYLKKQKNKNREYTHNLPNVHDFFGFFFFFVAALSLSLVLFIIVTFVSIFIKCFANWLCSVPFFFFRSRSPTHTHTYSWQSIRLFRFLFHIYLDAYGVDYSMSTQSVSKYTLTTPNENRTQIAVLPFFLSSSFLREKKRVSVPECVWV